MAQTLSQILVKLRKLYSESKTIATASIFETRLNLDVAVNSKLPHLIHHEGKSREGEDFVRGLGNQPVEPKLKNYLASPSYSTPSYYKDSLPTLKSGQYNYLTKKTDAELLEIVENTLHKGVFGRDYEKVASQMIAHLKVGKDFPFSTDFTNTKLLADIMVNQEGFKNLVSEIDRLFKQRMNQNEAAGDFTKINFLLQSIDNKTNQKYSDLKGFPFGVSFSSSPTLKTLVGGVQELDVNLVAIDYNFAVRDAFFKSESSTFKAKLALTIYDDFGVSEKDITNASPAASMGLEGLISLWILQKQRNYPPFRTVFKFDLPVTGTF